MQQESNLNNFLKRKNVLALFIALLALCIFPGLGGCADSEENISPLLHSPSISFLKTANSVDDGYESEDDSDASDAENSDSDCESDDECSSSSGSDSSSDSDNSDNDSIRSCNSSAYDSEDSDNDSDYASSSNSDSSDGAYDTDSEDEKNYKYSQPQILENLNLNSFSGKKVHILYRGHHFLKNKFTKKERAQEIKNNPVEQPIHSAAVMELTNGPAKPEIIGVIKKIQAEIEALDGTGGPTINGFTCLSGRDAFHHLYSNDYNKFSTYMRYKIRGEYYDFFKNLSFSSNPLVSCSDELLHGAKYAFGRKNYGSESITLTPDYDVNGKPRHPYLGRIFGIILKDENMESTHIYGVVPNHNEGNIKIKTHYSNNILSEREVSVVGSIPGESVVFSQLARVPSFNHEYREYYGRKYGLSKRRFDNIRVVLTNPHESQADKDDKISDMIDQIIKAKSQDNGLLYKSCFSPRVEELLGLKLSQFKMKPGYTDANGDWNAKKPQIIK